MDPRKQYFLSEIVQRWTMRGQAGEALHDEDKSLFVEWNLYKQRRQGERVFDPASLPFDLSSFLDDWITPDQIDGFDHGQLVMFFMPDNVEVKLEAYTKNSDIIDIYSKTYTYQKAKELLEKIMKTPCCIYDCNADVVYVSA